MMSFDIEEVISLCHKQREEFKECRKTGASPPEFALGLSSEEGKALIQESEILLNNIESCEKAGVLDKFRGYGRGYDLAWGLTTLCREVITKSRQAHQEGDLALSGALYVHAQQIADLAMRLRQGLLKSRRAAGRERRKNG